LFYSSLVSEYLSVAEIAVFFIDICSFDIMSNRYHFDLAYLVSKQ